MAGILDGFKDQMLRDQDEKSKQQSETPEPSEANNWGVESYAGAKKTEQEQQEFPKTGQIQ